MNAKKELQKALMDLKVPYWADDMECTLKYNYLENLINKALPKKLYRYRSFDKKMFSINALKNNEIWGSTASMFNDPLDTQICYDKQEIAKLVKDSFNFADDFFNYVRKNNRLPYKSNLKHIDIKTLQSLKKIPFEVPDDLDSIITETYNKFNFDLKTHVYIACFTENLYSTLMWSHYADSHKGFVLQYDFTSLQELPSIFPVIYSKQRVDASNYVTRAILHDLSKTIILTNFDTDLLLPTKIVLNKCYEWKYEKEWRLLYRIEDFISMYNPLKNGYKVISHMQPTAVFLGCQISTKNERLICQIAKEKKIPVYKMQYNTTDINSTGLESVLFQDC